MQNLEARFDHFVRSARTKGDQLDQVGQAINAALDKVPKTNHFSLFRFQPAASKILTTYDV